MERVWFAIYRLGGRSIMWGTRWRQAARRRLDDGGRRLVWFDVPATDLVGLRKQSDRPPVRMCCRCDHPIPAEQPFVRAPDGSTWHLECEGRQAAAPAPSRSATPTPALPENVVRLFDDEQLARDTGA